VLAPVSGFNTAFAVLQGLKNGVVNPALRTTERLFMSPLSDEGEYRRWNFVIPGSVLNDNTLANSTGLRFKVEFWYISGDFIGVEKYNTETGIADLLAADYPDATDGQYVRVIDTDTDWVLTDGVWEDFESKKAVGINKEVTQVADFQLEKGVFTGEPTHAPTNTELILEELSKMLRKDGSRPMTGDLDMDGNGIDNVGSVTLYDASGTAVLTYNGTDLILNKGASNEEILTDTITLADVANVIETNIATDDILIRSGTNYVNISKADFLQAVTDRLTVNESAITTLQTDKEDKSNKITAWNTPTDIQYPSAKLTKDTLDLKENTANKGATNGYAPLVSGLIPSAYIPNSYDNYEEVATYADLPATGRESTVYVVITDETSGGNTSTYRWTGSVYGKISDVLSASEVKTLYESNANTNAYTDAEKSKLAGLPSDVYSEPEVDGIIADYFSGYGVTQTDLTTTALTDTDTLSLTELDGKNEVLFVCRDTATNELDTDKVPVSELTNGTVLEFFDNANITATVGATDITFSNVGAGYTLKIYGIDLQPMTSEQVDFQNQTVDEALKGVDNESITYLADGKVNQVIGDNVTTTPTYDEYGNITKITEVYALDGKTYETTFTRNSEGKIINTNKQEVI
jgi:hypothetical protein